MIRSRRLHTRSSRIHMACLPFDRLITYTSASRRRRTTRTTVVVCFEPTCGVSVCSMRQLTRADLPSVDSTRTVSITTLSSRMSRNALVSASREIPGCTLRTASGSRLSSAAERVAHGRVGGLRLIGFGAPAALAGDPPESVCPQTMSVAVNQSRTHRCARRLERSVNAIAPPPPRRRWKRARRSRAREPRPRRTS